mgnify:CR=1 FL=1|tara:strand:+ start:237 stop:659 length:423 start_codon:yes stop_codon:yes gene_type:complete
MDNSGIETILLNLKMLAQIKANDKLYTEDGQIKIDTPTIMQGIYRWMNDFSRTKTMDDLDLLINKTYDFVNNNIKKETRTEEDNRNCQKILVEISKSLTGIQNLKITYTDDTFIQSRLDVINEKTLEIKNELSRQLQVPL